MLDPLPAPAVKTLLDCFVLDDPKCMRSVVDARSSTDSLVSIRVDVASKKDREVRLTIDWFVKGHSPVSARRTCEECTESVLRATIDAMLLDLAKTSPGFMGRIKVISDPPGIPVLLDGQTVGVTPVERDVPAGEHTLKLVRDGRTGEEKTITVESGSLAEVTLAPPPAGDDVPPAGRRSRVVPGIMIGIGLGGIAAGTALYLTSEEPSGENRTYRDTKLPGYIIGGAGAAVALTGVILIVATGRSSGPNVAMTPGGGATIGWTGRF